MIACSRLDWLAPNQRFLSSRCSTVPCPSTVKTENTDDLLFEAVRLARLAGQIQLRHFRSRSMGIEVKQQNDFNVVTSADKESESLIISAIRQAYPDHAILAEESGATDGEAGYRWVIDPLDGTTNFSAGLPIFSVSIAVELDGDPIVGVVFAPYLDELFTAVKGEGAWLNGNPISPSVTTSLSSAVVSTGFPYDKAQNPDNNLDNVARVMPLVRGLRRLGSAAVDLCYVAAGFLDGYWELNLNRWDIAAGSLIAREAGACVTSFRDDRGYSLIAATPAVHPLLAQLIE
ncbi:MAG: inositol monophosphatase [Muribaculaceae bacterium]|nr:inositol monophosphatase [Muribaculaceae bacterium]